MKENDKNSNTLGYKYITFINSVHYLQVGLKLLQRRKSVKEQAETVRLFRYNP